jgi:hypothetical protein
MESLAILIWPEQADTTKGKNVVIGDPRPEKGCRVNTIPQTGAGEAPQC